VHHPWCFVRCLNGYKITNGVSCDVVYRFYQGTCCCRFHHTRLRITAFTRIKGVRPTLRRLLTKLADAQQYNVQTCYTEFHQNLTINVESSDRNLFKPVSQVWRLLYWLSWNSATQYSFVGIRYIKFYVNRRKNIENKGNISFTSPSLEYFPLTDFHETPYCSTTWLGNRLYWLLSKSKENCRKCGQI